VRFQILRGGTLGKGFVWGVLNKEISIRGRGFFYFAAGLVYHGDWGSGLWGGGWGGCLFRRRGHRFTGLSSDWGGLLWGFGFSLARFGLVCGNSNRSGGLAYFGELLHFHPCLK